MGEQKGRQKTEIFNRGRSDTRTSGRSSHGSKRRYPSCSRRDLCQSSHGQLHCQIPSTRQIQMDIQLNKAINKWAGTRLEFEILFNLHSEQSGPRLPKSHTHPTCLLASHGVVYTLLASAASWYSVKHIPALLQLLGQTVLSHAIPS